MNPQYCCALCLGWCENSRVVVLTLAGDEHQGCNTQDGDEKHTVVRAVPIPAQQQ